jgi:CRP-like cAMP-binding protein
MGNFKNTILSHLESADPKAINRLQLRPVKLERKHTIEEPGDEIKNLFFIEEGIGSMTNTFKDGAQVEVGMFGSESVMGASYLMGTRRSLNKIYMQLAGHGFMCESEVALREFQRGESFHDLALRYVQAQLMQTAQSAGCNARHELEQRLSRWLLLCHDRANSDVMPITQEFLADMLGTGRPTVTVTAKKLQKQKMIEYRRGNVRIIDRTRLERTACECYRIVREHLDNYASNGAKMGAIR